jgi:hypothetical protein
MRIRWISGLVAVGAVVIGCGGAESPSEKGGGEGAQMSSSPLAVDCDALRADIDALRKDVTACCPLCKSLQCFRVAQDICCPITVNGGPIEKFEDAVKLYRDQCSPMCPASLCHTEPTNVCSPAGSCKQF